MFLYAGVLQHALWPSAWRIGTLKALNVNWRSYGGARLRSDALLCALAAIIDVNFVHDVAFVLVRVLILTFSELNFGYGPHAGNIVGYWALLCSLCFFCRRLCSCVVFIAQERGWVRSTLLFLPRHPQYFLQFFKFQSLCFTYIFFIYNFIFLLCIFFGFPLF